jgi:hypothetical protein
MARIIVNDFPDGLARGGRGSAPTPAAQIAIVAREFVANDTTLRFSRGCTGIGPSRGTSPSQEPRQDIRVRRRPQVNCPASPPGAARTCRKGEFPSAGSGSCLPYSVKMIRGASGLEFLFINARGRLDRQGANIASCDNARGSFDVAIQPGDEGP